MKPVLLMPIVAACALAASLKAEAAPIVEVGKTVARADYSLTFASITTGVDLTAYEESGIFVTTPDIGYTDWPVFTGYPRTSGFHYSDSGNNAFTTIRGVNSEVFTAADFLLGNGWAVPTNHVRYATYLDGVLTGGGVYEMYTGIVRISDVNGFDELRLNSHWEAPTPFGGFQAVALDDMHLQLLDPPLQVPEPGQIALFGAALIGWAAVRGRR